MNRAATLIRYMDEIGPNFLAGTSGQFVSKTEYDKTAVSHLWHGPRWWIIREKRREQ